MKKIMRALSAVMASLSMALLSINAFAATADQATPGTATPDQAGVVSNFPWARVITLIVIVVLIVAAIILAKTNTKLGQRINKFFKEYWSEIKKVSWYSPKDTAKATGIVLVLLIGAAIVIGLLDYGFTQIIKLLATIFN